MHGLTRIRFLGGILLAAVITAVTYDPPEVLGQKYDDPHSETKSQSMLIKPTLPAGQKLTAAQLAAHVDALILAQLSAERIDPSPRCSDEEFLRRVYLDVTGRIPTREQAVAFLDSKEPDKRARLIDELLDSKNFGKRQADVWQRLLLPRDSDNRRLLQYYEQLVTWLEEKFNDNTPWNEMVKAMITATGEVDKNGPVIYWVANNTVDKMTDNVTRSFLGIQLQCAQCHNHPFADWKQDEYWGMAAFFLNVRPSGNPNAAAKNGSAISIDERPKAKRGKRMALPESAKVLPPKFLQGSQARLRSTEPRRPALAGWMVSEQNPFFAKAMVNRTWGLFFGRGIVHPVDDMFAAHAPSHPELLADLEMQFIANGFDVKYLVRAICNSETYQRSSKPHGNNADVGPEHFARMAIKPLAPEMMYDALTDLTGSQRRGMARNRALMRGPGNQREAFVAFFSAEDGADPTEYHTGIPQVLRLMNSPQFSNVGGLGMVTARSARRPQESIDDLYLTVLARRPTAEERLRVNRYFNKTDDRREAMAGLTWALLNSSEFAMNR